MEPCSFLTSYTPNPFVSILPEDLLLLLDRHLNLGHLLKLLDTLLRLLARLDLCLTQMELLEPLLLVQAVASILGLLLLQMAGPNPRPLSLQLVQALQLIQAKDLY